MIGYDTRDFLTYHNVELDSQQDFLSIHTIVGNGGRTGEWLFNFTVQEEDTTSEMRCLMWARRQQNINMSVFISLPVNSCPCTLRQARFDWRYWFVFNWGLSSRPNCAMVLFSRSQSTIECCYDDFGALIVGANEGGSYQLYNPLFNHLDNYREDFQPYRHCCVMSRRCNLYYQYRPSDDCSEYIPPRRRKLMCNLSSILLQNIYSKLVELLSKGHIGIRSTDCPL